MTSVNNSLKLLPSILLIISTGAFAQVSTSANSDHIADTQQKLQQQRLEIIKQQTIATSPTVQINTNDFKSSSLLNKLSQHPENVNNNATKNVKANCFVINDIFLTGEEAHIFQFALKPAIVGDTSVLGNCFSVDDINDLMARIQNRIIDKGFVTTRVLTSNQDLTSGQLIFTVIAGRMDQLRLDTNKFDKNQTPRPIYSDDSGNPANFNSASLLKSGDILNIRDIEQTLENLKRVPTADANFAIAPSSRVNTPGYSDVLIDWKQPKFWRASASIDDSGTDTTGVYQGNVSIMVDNVSWHNDVLSLSAGHNLDGAFDEVDNDSWNYAVNYTIPWFNSLMTVSHNGYNYKQTVAGAYQDYVYSGDSFGTTASYKYLAHRDSRSKTFLLSNIFVKQQRNYIDDTEIEVQRRKTAGWSAGMSYETNFNNKSITADWMYQRGIDAFGALIAPEELFNEGSTKAGLFKGNLNITAPFTLSDKKLTYSLKAKGQLALDDLLPANRFGIGGRDTVRGFSGERSLSGDHGVFVRQEFSLPVSQSGAHSVFAGVDVGFVDVTDKARADLLLGHSLTGAAVGFRGSVQPLKTSYDVFVAYPLAQPDGFSQKEVTSGFRLNWQF